MRKSLALIILLSITMSALADRAFTREELIVMEQLDTLPDKYTMIGRNTAVENRIPFKECVMKTNEIIKEISVGGYPTKETKDSGRSDLSDTNFKSYEAKAWTNTGMVTVLCLSISDEPDTMTIRRDPYE